MFAKVLMTCMALVLLVSQPAWSAGPLRIDGSSDAAAERSFQRMLSGLQPEVQKELLIALVQINMIGAKSATDVLNDPGLQHPSAARIKDRIVGMTASEIIELARNTATTKAFVRGAEPGVPTDLLRPLQKVTASQELADTSWVIEDDVNGHLQRSVYAFHPDHTATLIETNRKPAGTTRWEQSGNTVRLSINDGHAILLGDFTSPSTMSGKGGNKMGVRWTWTARKR